MKHEPWAKRWVGKSFVRFHRGRQETRHVVDTTLGCDVWYISGRKTWRRVAQGGSARCTSAEWEAWVKDAVRKP